jgi:hypothetical protein
MTDKLGIQELNVNDTIETTSRLESVEIGTSTDSEKTLYPLSSGAKLELQKKGKDIFEFSFAELKSTRLKIFIKASELEGKFKKEEKNK